MMEEQRTIIIGSGGMGREVLWIMRAHNEAGCKPFYCIEGFVTSIREQHGHDVCGVPVLGPEEYVLDRPECQVVCALGSPRDRLRLINKFLGHDVRFTTVIHPTATISSYVTIGEGCIISANVAITTQVGISNHVIVNVNTSVSHDSHLEDFATLAPGVNIAGSVTIGYGADLGINCSVIPHMMIGRGAVIGAGSVVTKNVEDNCVAVGVPAKIIHKLPSEDWL
jgi:sugar O-acyltransferase (sialic acid O-acetyltransferase NeuD family)